MSRKLIRDAFEKRLDTLTPAWHTAWQNVKYQPESDDPWQRADLMFGETRSGGFGADAGEIWTGIFQISLFSPAQKGPQVAEDRATLLRGDRALGTQGLFYRGLNLTEGGLRITIYQPYDGNDFEEPRWWGFPVKIPFDCHVP